MKRFIAAAVIAAFFASGIYGCANKAQTGAGLGALAGATVGALTAKNKIGGAAIGAGLGLALGYIIGNEMDKYDRQQLDNTLENQKSGQTSSWRNPDTGAQYDATPGPAYSENDKVYRSVTIKATDSNGKVQDVQAKAYRNSDGTWALVQ